MIEGQETDRRSLDISAHECDFLVKSLRDIGAWFVQHLSLDYPQGVGEYPSGSRILIIPWTVTLPFFKILNRETSMMKHRVLVHHHHPDGKHFPLPEWEREAWQPGSDPDTNCKRHSKPCKLMWLKGGSAGYLVESLAPWWQKIPTSDIMTPSLGVARHTENTNVRLLFQITVLSVYTPCSPDKLGFLLILIWLQLAVIEFLWPSLICGKVSLTVKPIDIFLCYRLFHIIATQDDMMKVNWFYWLLRFSTVVRRSSVLCTHTVTVQAS